MRVIIIKNKLFIFVIIMLSLTAYTIYGGILDKEELEVINDIHDFFNALKKSLGDRAIDIAIRDSIKYEIDDIDVDNNSAIAEIQLTGLDLAQSFYEMDMFHTFYREFSLNSGLLFTEPVMDTYDVYMYILNKNMQNTKNTDLTLQLNKPDQKWNVVNQGDVYRAIESISIDLKLITDKAYENLEKARNSTREKYTTEQPDMEFEEYWVEYLYDFITNRGFVTQFPFQEQQFVPIND